MKKIALIFLTAMLIGNFQANAQLGVKLGYNFAKMTGDVDAGYSEKSLNNLTLGAFLDKDLIPLLDLRLGVDYSPKGSRQENGNDFDQLQLNYLEIPIQAKIKLGPVYALGGVYGSFALKGRYESEELGTSYSGDVDFDAMELKKFDYGMKFGAGFQVGLGPLHAFAQGEYSFGLLNLSKADGIDTKNKVISLSAGVIIGF